MSNSSNKKISVETERDSTNNKESAKEIENKVKTSDKTTITKQNDQAATVEIQADITKDKSPKTVNNSVELNTTSGNIKIIGEIDSDDSMYYDETSGSYFNTDSGDSEPQMGVWDDSDDDLSILEDFLELKEGAFKKKFKRTDEKSVEANPPLFTARCKIKLLRAYEDVIVTVDTFNLIYIIENGESKTYRIKFFKITNFTRVGDKIYFISESSAALHSLAIKTGEIVSVKKHLRSPTAICKLGENIVILGEKLSLLSGSMELINDIGLKYIDICVLNDKILALKESGEINIYSAALKLEREHVLPNKFTFKRLFSNEKNLFVGTDSGMVIFKGDSDLSTLENVKELNNLTEVAHSFDYTSKFAIYASVGPQTLRIIKNDTFKPMETFPHKTLGKTTIGGISVLGNKILIASERNILEFIIEK